MANAREIRDRMRSIQDTMKITNAMYMISSSKLRRAKKALANTEPYFYALQSAISRLLRHIPDAKSRYFDQHEEIPDDKKRRGYIVITADKGLAGAYNHNVIKMAHELFEQGENNKLFVVGELGRQYFTKEGLEVDTEFKYTVQNPSLHRARVITERILELYNNNELDEVYIIYTKMENSFSMEAEMMQCNTVEEMMYCIPQCIPSLKCDAMYLVLDDHLNAYKKEAEKSIHLDAAPSDEGFYVHGYPRQMQMTFAYERDQRLDLDRQDGIFPTFDYPKPGQDFLFLPLHFGERTVGYVVIRNAVYLMKKQYLFQIMNALTRSMENLHKKEMLAYMNKKLSSLYIMDTLTGMYNRMGYQQLGEKAFQISKRNHRKLLILFVDLDRLKYINDTFGHEYGDMAICAAARALMQCSSRDAVPARTGGDEFVVVQTYQSDEASRDLVHRIRRTLEAEGKAQKLPFPLTMSIGTVVTDPDSNLTFADYVKQADSLMYEEKVQKRAARK